jgi:hypothetical protein
VRKKKSPVEGAPEMARLRFLGGISLRIHKGYGSWGNDEEKSEEEESGDQENCGCAEEKRGAADEEGNESRGSAERALQARRDARDKDDEGGDQSGRNRTASTAEVLA